MATRARLLLLAIILLGFGLRLYLLDGQSLWYDEGVTATIAQRDLAALTAWTARDIQPPLYYYLVAGWGRLGGWSEWSLRFPSAALGVLALPLLAAVARRLIPLHTAALLAALLAAVHPLLVYYGQEARMYTLLVCLAVLIAWLLLRLADAPGRAWGGWLAYVAAAAAAVYTHYFAWFLLAALGLAWLLDERRGHEGVPAEPHVGVRATRMTVGSRLAWLMAANLAVIVLYLPWLANLGTQLRVDRSYWLGDLKLHEALLDAAISFTSGETMGERTALWLLIAYTLVTAVAVWGLWGRWPETRRLALYAGLWLLVPLAAVLALAFNVPKFNARYVMLALPALLLLWAGGLAALAAPRSPGRSTVQSARPVRAGAGRFQSGETIRRTRRADWTSGEGEPPRRAAHWRAPQLVAALCVLLLLGGALWSNANWFFDRAFAKDDWRGLTAFLRDRVAADENIVLVSGHAWPVWGYYAPDLPVVRLPEIEILDVGAVLDFGTTQPPLAVAFADETGKRGAWLVNWQDEVVDPNNVTPVQLELGGREKGQSATFAGLGLRRFGGIRASRFAAEPPVAHVLDIDLGGQVILHGYTVANNGDLLLFWQRPTAAADAGDLRMALRTVTLEGQPLAQPQDRRLAGYTYPSFRWPQHQIVMGHVPAANWLGAVPVAGDAPYTSTVQVALRVYDGEDPAATPLLTPAGDDHITLPAVEVVID